VLTLQGDLVYANYGEEKDFKLLSTKGVSCQDKIVILRYGRIFPGQMVKHFWMSMHSFFFRYDVILSRRRPWPWRPPAARCICPLARRVRKHFWTCLYICVFFLYDVILSKQRPWRPPVTLLAFCVRYSSWSIVHSYFYYQAEVLTVPVFHKKSCFISSHT